MRKILLFVFTCVALLSCDQHKTTKEQTLTSTKNASDSLTIELDSIQKNGQIIGFSVAVVNESNVLYEKGFGFADKAAKTPYTKNTIQLIASVSKTLIGLALMKAQEMGKLKLDDPIHNYLPFKVMNPYHPNEKITIRQLATHTSGINDSEKYMNNSWVLTTHQDVSNLRTDYPDQRLNPADMSMPMEQFLQEYLVADGSLYHQENYIDFKAGKRFNYSNIGATLCALVIEKATGQSYDAFTTEHILKPLGMDASGWSLEEVDISKHTKLYRIDHSVLPFYTLITYPDGMLITSSHDMTKYLIELIKGYSGTGTLLSKKSYQEFYREQLTALHFGEGERNANHPYDADYNPAIFIGHSALGYAGHSGGDAGVATWMYFDKKKKIGRFIMVNTDLGDREKELEYYKVWDTMDNYLDRL